MRILTTAFLALIVSVAVATSVQASMSVELQQQEAVIMTVTNEGKMTTSNYEQFVLANDEISAKAAELKGQNAHILFFETGEEKYCVDLRSTAEPVFDILAIQKQQNRQEEKTLY